MKILKDKDLRFMLFSKEGETLNDDMDQQPRITLIGGHDWMERLTVALADHFDCKIARIEVNAIDEYSPKTCENFIVKVWTDNRDMEFYLVRCYNY